MVNKTPCLLLVSSSLIWHQYSLWLHLFKHPLQLIISLNLASSWFFTKWEKPHDCLQNEKKCRSKWIVKTFYLMYLISFIIYLLKKKKTTLFPGFFCSVAIETVSGVRKLTWFPSKAKLEEEKLTNRVQHPYLHTARQRVQAGILKVFHYHTLTFCHGDEW